jgi:hypothetical protein
MPTKKDFIITLVQYFHSYDEHDNAPDVRQTGPRLIYIRSLPSIQGWFKADFKGVIDHEDDADFTSTMELQLGKMLTPRVGLYAEAFLGDDALDSDAYESAFGLALRYMY